MFKWVEKFWASEAEWCFTSQEVQPRRHRPYAESHLFIEMSSKLAVWLTIRVMDGLISPYNSGRVQAVLARALSLHSQREFFQRK